MKFSIALVLLFCGEAAASGRHRKACGESSGCNYVVVPHEAGEAPGNEDFARLLLEAHDGRRTEDVMSIVTTLNPSDSGVLSPSASPPSSGGGVPSPTATSGNGDASPDSDGSNSEMSSPPDGSGPGSCQTDEGFFGSMEGNQVTVTFGYELETDATLTSETLVTDALPPLENSFNDFLLPTLFPSDCAQGTRQRKLQGVHRRLRLMGISVRPDDTPLEDVVCAGQSDPGNSCVVIRGQISLFIDESTRRLQEESALVQRTIQVGMSTGAFDDAHPGIVRVSYVDLEGSGSGVSPPVNEGDRDAPQDSSSSSNGLLIGLMIAGAGTLFIVLGAIMYRRKKSKDIDDSDPASTIGPETTLGHDTVADETDEGPEAGKSSPQRARASSGEYSALTAPFPSTGSVTTVDSNFVKRFEHV